MSFHCLSAVPKNSARLGRALSLRSAGGQWKLTYLSSVFFNLFCARRYLTIAIKTLQCHWPEYLMEAGELAVFMISACAFGVILEHPASPVHQAIPNPFLRRALMGLAMGTTAIGIIYSPWGKQSGAHLNPSITLTFFRLGKIAPWDTLFYVVAQFIGGMAGVLLVSELIGALLADPAVRYVATVPGSHVAVAFIAEVLISFMLMLTVLLVSNRRNIARYTGLFAGTLVATYITLEAPISGMSMNPARTFGSAFSSQIWTALWIYFIAPPLGMLLASEFFVRLRGTRQVICAKLHHDNDKRCIFLHCNYKSNERKLKAI